MLTDAYSATPLPLLHVFYPSLNAVLPKKDVKHSILRVKGEWDLLPPLLDGDMFGSSCGACIALTMLKLMCEWHFSHE
eukprot:24153-Eustigmatos_ZCMA.PRE.1